MGKLEKLFYMEKEAKYMREALEQILVAPTLKQNQKKTIS